MPCVHAQTRTVEDDQDLINWYYAATFGTGIYTAGDRTVGVLKIPVSRTLRKSSDDQWGLRLILPVTIGVYDFSFDSVVEDGLPDRLNTLSFVPGLEFEKRIVPRWLLKPYASAGAGWELGGDESAVIYDVGLRSRYRLGRHRETELKEEERPPRGGTESRILQEYLEAVKVKRRLEQEVEDRKSNIRDQDRLLQETDQEDPAEGSDLQIAVRGMVYPGVSVEMTRPVEPDDLELTVSRKTVKGGDHRLKEIADELSKEQDVHTVNGAHGGNIRSSIHPFYQRHY